jgi:hypothetical protein
MGEHMDNKKKITAAISAVINYIQEEEAAVYRQSMMAAAQAPASAMSIPVPEELQVEPTSPIPGPAATTVVPQGSATTVGLWGASGRQSQMHLRNLMQLRAFNRI